VSFGASIFPVKTIEQKFNLTVDTGSNITVLFDKNCFSQHRYLGENIIGNCSKVWSGWGAGQRYFDKNKSSDTYQSINQIKWLNHSYFRFYYGISAWEKFNFNTTIVGS